MPHNGDNSVHAVSSFSGLGEARKFFRIGIYSKKTNKVKTQKKIKLLILSFSAVADIRTDFIQPEV
ncbi:hypothetical protein DU80_10900 [Methanosarcina mazei]|jgi:hypothetical protein|uniref:Uncharacterized protein n=1 Tax=Methanosarcina mazei TaxID=2209 RepID=A0A0F8EAR3_METMZ|nr:hypothetical protein DU31_08600 [Methanosarcina mazei]KKG04651.1 hypothetical protein DU47_12100 [Methanosarcina mazei]KKG32501.1 hypothetical protein DU30_13330 [Methanosarcina mazei]KKG36881.1 hypothetical protein DU52_16170 [Methanosarcina mazei]KKG57443.1 hypothetical protein DU45_00990 [Methanosarcina mazei]